MIFNNKDYNIPKITIGCEALGGTDWGNKDIEVLTKVINEAFDYGYNCFDTADVYGLGESEKRIGNIFKNRKDKVFIITKFGIRWHQKNKSRRALTYKDLSVEYLRKALEGSLSRLQIDAIPLYLVHWPDINYELEPIIEEMIKQKEKGKILNFGLSNFSLSNITSNALSKIDAICNSYNMLDTKSNKHILDEGKKLNKSIFVYGTLAQGLLTGKFKNNYVFDMTDRRSRLEHFKNLNNNDLQDIINKISEIGMKINNTPAQVVHKWVMTKQVANSSILGISNLTQLKELLDVSNSSLEESFIKDLDYLSNKYINNILN